jgi:hypothetical protein
VHELLSELLHYANAPDSPKLQAFFDSKIVNYKELFAQQSRRCDENNTRESKLSWGENDKSKSMLNEKANPDGAANRGINTVYGFLLMKKKSVKKVNLFSINQSKQPLRVNNMQMVLIQPHCIRNQCNV